MFSQFLNKIISYITTLFSSSNKVSSMRVVFVLGVLFSLVFGAYLLNKTLFILSQSPEGIATLSTTLGVIFGGIVGVITSLSGFKVQQSKVDGKITTENKNTEAPSSDENNKPQ